MGWLTGSALAGRSLGEMPSLLLDLLHRTASVEGLSAERSSDSRYKSVGGWIGHENI
jgi:hypothetical protein